MGQFLSFKTPLTATPLSTASKANNAGAFPSSSYTLTDVENGGDNIPLPKSGPVAFTTTGMPVFPPYNDQGNLAWQMCEMDKCNAHVGKGFDYHYHGDPFGAEGECMYSASDYNSTDAHPPLVRSGWLWKVALLEVLQTSSNFSDCVALGAGKIQNYGSL